MSQDEETRRHSRIEVQTPAGRREVVQSQVTRYPAEREGFSAGMVAAVALAAVAATAVIFFLFFMNPREDESSTNINIRTAGVQPTPVVQTPVIVQPTPMMQPTPIIIQQAPPVTTEAPPIIIQQPAPATQPAPRTAAAPAAPSGADDAALQTKVDKAFQDDADISGATVNATVVNGKVLLIGTVKSASLKQKAEALARAVKGISSVENKINVDPDAP